MDFEIPLQDQLPAGHPARVCFGCGADNQEGLRIKSYLQGDTAVCRFRPSQEHTAFPGVLNGGIIATLLDCHGIWTAVGQHHARYQEPEAGSQETMYMTRKMTVEYLRPTPMDTELLLQGRVLEARERSMQVEVELWAKGEMTAKAELLAVRAR
ncbi:MAG: PaaI family thioesterase [Desulfohalobiaceae bacterium]